MPAVNPGETYFADTNLLLYALDERDPRKRAQAAAWMEHLWTTGRGRLSWQVLNEFYVNAVRKPGTPAREARKAVQLLAKWKPGGLSLEMVERAWHWSDHAQLSYWDAMIVASAERQGCAVLLSEDFQAGRVYGGVRVVNPFVQTPSGPVL